MVVVVVVVFRSVTDDSSLPPGRYSISTSSVLLIISNIAFRCAGCPSEDMVMPEKAVRVDHEKKTKIKNKNSESNNKNNQRGGIRPSDCSRHAE